MLKSTSQLAFKGYQSLNNTMWLWVRWFAWTGVGRLLQTNEKIQVVCCV